MRKRLSELQRKSKIFIAVVVDFLSGFFSWFVFGPPGSLFIAERFSRNIIEIAGDNLANFILPISLSLLFSFIFGFYSQIIRFYDSSSRIWVPVGSCLIFGLSWSIVYLSKFEYLVPGFLYVVLAQGIVISTVYFSLLSTSRNIAKSLLNQKSSSVHSILFLKVRFHL